MAMNDIADHSPSGERLTKARLQLSSWGVAQVAELVDALVSGLKFGPLTAVTH
jgi:hypothetical protein